MCRTHCLQVETRTHQLMRWLLVLIVAPAACAIDETADEGFACETDEDCRVGYFCAADDDESIDRCVEISERPPCSMAEDRDNDGFSFVSEDGSCDVPNNLALDCDDTTTRQSTNSIASSSVTITPRT